MKKKCILLVEDDPILRSLMKEALEKEYEILEASNYSGVINQCKNQIDLAIIDYFLPDRDGFEVLKSLRKEKPFLPAIMITAYSTEALAIEAVRAGVNEYIRKPFYFEHLKMRVSEIFDGKKSLKYFESPANRDESIIEFLINHIRNNYMNDITRDRLAKMVYMDKHKLSKEFKKRTGQSLPSYINGLRIENAGELLKNPNPSIKEVAYSVGFKSIEHFSRLFRAIYGTSPCEFRQRVKQEPLPRDFSHSALV